MKVIELFAGIGSQTQALKNLGIEHTSKISEIDKFAIQSYNAIHGETENLGDITKIEELKYADLVTYSFPCFIEGTKVLTYEGFKNIEDVNYGDMVLTHNNRYKKVVKPMINEADHIYKLGTMCSDDLFVTEEHPFYIRKKYKVWDNANRKYKRLFKEATWVKAKELNKDCYVGVAINNESKLPKWRGVTFKLSNSNRTEHLNILVEKFKHKDFWWLIGAYMGDGWIISGKGIVICGNDVKIKKIIKKLKSLDFNYSISKERTVSKIHIPFKEIGEYVEQFGRGAKNKKLTGDILNLPIDLLEGFLDGYMSADGCYVQGFNKATSISNELIYGIGQCVAKVYQRPFSIYKTVRPNKRIIEGRLVNQNDTYQIAWKNKKNKQDKAFFEDGYVWCPINNIEKLEYEGNVYNFEVEEDNSYVVQNVIVHNCQDLSIAGKQKGIKEGTRSGLLLEVERLIEGMEIKPKFLLLENVKNLVGKKHKPDFDRWLNKLEELGYINYWEVLNAKDYGIPQNRERVFCLSIRKDLDVGFSFPEKQELKLRLKDLLEDKVDNRFYLSEEQTINTHYFNKELNELKTNRIANIYGEDKGTGFAGNVWDKTGIPPTITTMQGGNRQPMIIIDKSIKKSVAVNFEKELDEISTTTKDIYQAECSSGWQDNKIGINISQCLRANNNFHPCLDNNFTIRKLTPKECWRLQGFKDEQFEKAEKVCSNSQLYKQAGNSIVVNVLEEIFKKMIEFGYIENNEKKR